MSLLAPLQGSPLAPGIARWSSWSPPIRYGLLTGLIAIALTIRVWPTAPVTPPVTHSTPPQSETTAVLEPLRLSQLHTLTANWPQVGITNQRERFDLAMQVNWTQLYALAELLSTSAHHADNYRFSWSDASAAKSAFAMTMQLQPGRYRASPTTFTLPERSPSAPDPTVHCHSPTPPSVEIVAIWPTRNTVQLVGQFGVLRMKRDQLIDNTWLLAAIERDFVEFSWQPPDPRCPVKVFTVAI